MQLGGPPIHRHMGDPPDDAVFRPSFSTAPATKLILVYHPTFQRGLLGSDVLADNRHSGITEHARGIKIGAREGRLGHVEVFLQMCCFSTSIFERPRHFLCLQHTPITKPIYTQNSEEPVKANRQGPRVVREPCRLVSVVPCCGGLAPWLSRRRPRRSWRSRTPLRRAVGLPNRPRR